MEIHGDHAGYNDPAIATAIGSIDGKSYMFIGHQKGRNTKENIAHNFAMPTPHGYRKALRMMKYADHHQFPIITFVDTPGAFADLKSEELGQGEAIVKNLRTMFGLKVPIITAVTGEGGSGGALAIAYSNKLFMLENSVVYVASPEACAAILWKSSQAAPKAAEKLKITAQEHYRLGIADGVIPEPLGRAHADPTWTSQQIKLVITKAMEVNSSKITDIESKLQSLKKKILEAKGPFEFDPFSKEAIQKLVKEADQEITKALISTGLADKVQFVNMELSKVSLNQPLNSSIKEKLDKIMQEIKSKMSQPGAYLGLKQKLQKLDTIGESSDIELVEKAVEVKKELEEVLKSANLEIVEVMEREGLKDQIKELESEITQGSNSEDVEKMEKRIKECILVALDVT
ncbi:Acetyl-coenzyme A carboxylase carboxyl transferase subunit alpha [Spatholobus suberectus]|nr:Acetyl-coenzyme A carboxylase carboxyl transferase subunit alpha [Spatholobus suberectus]